jgi:F0F1-type ATP synthase assembly protein I
LADRPPEVPDFKKVFSPVINLGLNMAAGMVVFAGIGYWLDQRYGGDSGGWLLAGIFLGLFYGGYEVWKAIRLLNQADNDTASQIKKGP